MAAPTNAARVKILLANSEPSTHGPKRRLARRKAVSVFGGKAEVDDAPSKRRF
jgi:hypothetical protein